MSDLRVSRILHAGYVFEKDGVKIAFDPIFENPFSRNCYAFPEVKFDVAGLRREKFDAVFISHYHDDHCSFESLDLVNRETPIYMFCVFDEMFELLRELGFKNVHSLRLDHEISIGPFKITPRRALDEDVDSIFQIATDDFNLLNVVDSWIGPETMNTLTRTKWDLILWPFQTMRELEVLSPGDSLSAPPEIPREWLEQLQILNPKFLVPSSCQFRMESWSWLNRAFFPISYGHFKNEMSSELPNAEIIRMNPGVSFLFSKHGIRQDGRLPWVTPIGDQNADYEFDPNIEVPPTAKIAKHFPPLTSDEAKIVIDYCEHGLPEKFASLEPDEFFETPRHWMLSLFDPNGERKVLRYTVHGSKIERANEYKSAEWLTEIPIAKLYGALANGESLTSIYARIHAPEGADLLSDPLLRSLYSGAFASYQKAQLRRPRSEVSAPSGNKNNPR